MALWALRQAQPHPPAFTCPQVLGSPADICSHLDTAIRPEACHALQPTSSSTSTPPFVLLETPDVSSTTGQGHQRPSSPATASPRSGSRGNTLPPHRVDRPQLLFVPSPRAQPSSRVVGWGLPFRICRVARGSPVPNPTGSRYPATGSSVSEPLAGYYPESLLRRVQKPFWRFSSARLVTCVHRVQRLQRSHQHYEYREVQPRPQVSQSPTPTMNQSQQFSAPRHQNATGSVGSVGSYGSASASAPGPASAIASGQQQDELHMSGMSPQRQHMSPPEYAPQIKLEQPPPPIAHNRPHSHYQPSQAASSVPNVLQPGGLTARPAAVSANTAPTLPTIQGAVPSPQDPHQPQDFQTPSKPSLNMSHTYSRSSSGGAYDAPGGYHPYTPTTPGGGGSSSQFISPTDIPKYNQPGSQRHISNTPLGLADIRPRADSSMSDGGPGTLGYDLAHTQAGTSNYMAPWPIYAFDWCKWRPQANGAGKLAVGSYLEDGHNFVSLPNFIW